MSLLKRLWGLLFRLFPCPAPLGLREIGHPGPTSPILVTCNFDLTVRRLMRVLRHQDCYLLVAESGGVNVWCAAGGHVFDTRSVVSAVKVSGIAARVDHRRLILPPLAGPGVRALDVEEETGFQVVWGPVHMEDLPTFLSSGLVRTPAMRRVRWRWGERLDAALGSLFPFLFVGAAGVALIAPTWLFDYALVTAITFLLFWTVVPWLPGSVGLLRGLTFALLPLSLLGVIRLLAPGQVGWLRGDLLLATGLSLLFGAEVGGLAPTLGSDLDPLLARLGVRSLGNIAFAGTVRTDLLNGFRLLSQDHDRCDACLHCVEVCPLGCWERASDGKASLEHLEACVACTACLLQCRSGAIHAHRREPSA